MSLIINEKRKQSVQYDSKSDFSLNKLPEEPFKAKKKAHIKTKSCVDYSSPNQIGSKGEDDNEERVSNNINDSANDDEDGIGFLAKTKSKDNEDKSKFASSVKQPKGSFDISSLPKKQKDFKMKHIASSFSAKKDKTALHQKTAFAGHSAAGRNMRGEVKINQDSLITFQHVFNTNFSYHILAVFDGHGPNGHFVSDFLKNYFTKYFTSTEGVNFIKKWTFAKAKEKLECYATIKKCYAKAEEQMIKSGTEFKNSGSTGIIVTILIDIIICFNTGDSRAIYISADGQTHAISEDHKPNNPNEEKRISKQGGIVESRKEDGENGPHRVFSKSNNENGLAISRSIGDFEMKEAGVISDPDYFELSIRSNRIKVIVLGSDGIWDVLSNNDVKSIIEPYLSAKDSIEASKQLVQIATKEWLAKGVNCDDISVIVYFT